MLNLFIWSFDIILTSDQIAELEIIAKPLMVWLEKNCHPHVKAIVDSERTQVLEGLATAMKRSHYDFDE